MNKSYPYKVTASLVVYNNSSKMVLKTIASFLDTDLAVRLFVLDNSPNNNLKSLCNDSRTEYYNTGDNIGFGAAHNIILKQAERLGKYHIILNPDIIIEKGTLERLVHYMNENNEVAGLNPKIVYPNGECQHLPKLYPTPFDLIIRFVPFLNKCLARHEKRYTLANVKLEEPYEVGIISGCFMMIRSSFFSEFIFDERYFMYFEDFDLSRRLAQKSRLMLVPDVSVIHYYERGSRKSWFLFKTLIASMVKYFNKYGWFFDRHRKEFNKKILSQF